MKNGKNGNFGSYVIMGAGIALGFVTVSVLVTGVSMLASEGVKMLKSVQMPSLSAANGSAAVNGTTRGQTYMPSGYAQQPSAVPEEQRVYY